ncbi:origin recognition complex subunit 1 isoform X1 [Bombus terrestris]|uniref:Origin recognition complex subunit 1 n=1 Tax=Bombus terrestris TaxID=30195 RepID=A0A9C6WAK4_BOMTE|nr:origin recognition complex subunit 1 isoform X1 [Bombus terrestris]
MSMRLSKCSDHEITIILDTESNSDKEQESYDDITAAKIQKKRKNVIDISPDTKNVLNISSESENVFQKFKYTLPKNNILHKDQVSLKIKLRRSTEKSLYKIDTDSECENSIRRSRSRLQRQRKKSNPEVENKKSYIDNKDNSIKNNANDDSKLIPGEIDGDISRKGRNRRPPLRLSYYECDTIRRINSPSLRDRKAINYNEDKLFINSIVSNMKNNKKLLNQQKKETPNSSIDKQNLEVKPVYSNTRNNKRNRILSEKGEENDSSTDSKTSKAKLLKKSNKSKSTNDKLDHAPTKDEEDVSDIDSKISRAKSLKRSNKSESRSDMLDHAPTKDEEDVSDINSKISRAKSLKRSNKSGSRSDMLDHAAIKDEEDVSDTDSKISRAKSLKKSSKSESRSDKLDHALKIHETIKKQDSSTSTNSTPVKLVKQKRVICENTPKQIQSVGNNDSDTEGECLANTYKRIKISSAVKNSANSTNSTPVKINKQKGVINNKNNNDAEDEYLSDMYKRIKISSAKKNILTPQTRNNMQNSIESCLEKTHLSTPKSRPKYNNLTPSLIKRKSALLKPNTPLQEARSRLHVSAVPKSLPCREEEFNNIFTFLRGKLEDKSGGCIYISGVPGTGKTATVNEAVRCLQRLIVKGQLDDFDYVAINGMKLTEPRQAYVQILKQLNGRTATWEQSYHTLEKRFHSSASKMTLLLVDELDLLCTKRQDVVYNLLDWPTKSTAQLVVITIANTMDLPERVLMGRVTSRLGLTRLTFQPYNFKQLQEIVTSRLKDYDGFRSEAVQLVARKVSAVSGDARRALDICRRAMEIAELRNAETISLQDVSEAVSEMIASAKVQAIKHCSKVEKIFLLAVSAEVTRTSIEEVYFKNAYRQVESLCSFDGIEVPTITEILAVCARLGSNRLLICENSKNDIHQKILLNVSTDDIHYATQELDLN